MTRTRAALALTAAALLALTACGGGDDGGTDTASVEADVRQAVDDNLAAINDGDIDQIRELTSTRCREATSEDEVRQMVDLIDTMYGDISYTELTITDITEDSARAHGSTGIQALDEAGDDEGALWTLEDGAWRADDC